MKTKTIVIAFLAWSVICVVLTVLVLRLITGESRSDEDIKQLDETNAIMMAENVLNRKKLEQSKKKIKRLTEQLDSVKTEIITHKENVKRDEKEYKKVDDLIAELDLAIQQVNGK